MCRYLATGSCAAIRRAVWIFSVLLVLPGGMLSAATPADTSAPTSEELVREALRSELQGNAPERTRLLEAALARDPDCGPARWQLGFVRVGDKWFPAGETPADPAKDKLLNAYRVKRDAMIDTADNHRDLAIWCHRRKLDEHSRVHWAKVLEFDAMNAEALQALGLQDYNGQLMTRAQIEREKKRAIEERSAAEKWQAQARKWRKMLESGSDEQHEKALTEIAAVTDPMAIDALTSLSSASSGEDRRELSKLVLTVIGTIKHPTATNLLLRTALGGGAPEMRSLAMEQLKKRPMHAYVPQLLAEMPGTVKTQWQIFLMPNGSVAHFHTIAMEGRQADVITTNESIVSPDLNTVATTTPAALRNAQRSVVQLETAAASVRQATERKRQQVLNVLEQTTGFKDLTDPAQWNKQLNDYYGWYTPMEPPKPVSYERTYQQSATFRASPDTETTLATMPPTPPPSLLSRNSCFPAGTLVTTDHGAVRIEQIKIGDYVLAQDLTSGELAYRSVQTITLNPPRQLVKINTPGESLVATPGHPFWVAGEGWCVARHLKPGQQVHSLNGAVKVESIEDAPEREVYNLVVSDAHNYFVGNAGLLVHDNSPLVEDAMVLPGLRDSER